MIGYRLAYLSLPTIHSNQILISWNKGGLGICEYIKVHISRCKFSQLALCKPLVSRINHIQILGKTRNQWPFDLFIDLILIKHKWHLKRRNLSIFSWIAKLNRKEFSLLLWNCLGPFITTWWFSRVYLVWMVLVYLGNLFYESGFSYTLRITYPRFLLFNLWLVTPW